MITESPSSRDAQTVPPSDREATYREEFLKLLARLDMQPAEAIALVEAATGRLFQTCSPTQLVPVLQELLEVVRSYLRPIDARTPER
jgi:hypothetical protein